MTRLDGGCPTGCGRGVEPGKLMCRVCWGKVPADLQAKVYATWKTYRANALNSNTSTEKKRELRNAYTEARDNAIASIR